MGEARAMPMKITIVTTEIRIFIGCSCWKPWWDLEYFLEGRE